MASIFNDIFGGGTTTSTSTPSNFNPLTTALAPGVTNAFTSAINQGPMQYTGPLTPTGTTAQNTSLTNLANAVAPGNSVNNYISSVLNGSYMPGGANGNPFVSAAIQGANQPIQENAQTLLTQANPETFAASGQAVQGTGSSAFANAQNLGVQSAVNAESANATNIENQAYQTGVAQMTAAANLQPQEVNSAINVLQAQLLPTLLQEQGITNGLQAFQENVTSLTSFLQTMAGAINPVLGTTTTSQGNTTPGILPDITSLFSGSKGGSSAAGNIASGASSIFSS